VASSSGRRESSTSDGPRADHVVARVMERTHAWAFLWEILLQGEFAMTAYRAVADDPTGDDVWMHIQSFLGAAANISKVLWGTGKSREAIARRERRRPLREQLGVGEQSALQSRTLRDHFEHVDERIDRWWERSQQVGGASMINYNTAPIDAIRKGLPDLSDEERFRHFDPDTRVLRFGGDELPLALLAEEVERVRRSAKEAITRYESHT
jgi:hypothetical protein